MYGNICYLKLLWRSNFAENPDMIHAFVKMYVLYGWWYTVHDLHAVLEIC